MHKKHIRIPDNMDFSDKTKYNGTDVIKFILLDFLENFKTCGMKDLEGLMDKCINDFLKKNTEVNLEKKYQNFLKSTGDAFLGLNPTSDSADVFSLISLYGDKYLANKELLSTPQNQPTPQV
jgi:hypothetical protein